MLEFREDYSYKIRDTIVLSFFRDGTETEMALMHQKLICSIPE